MMSQNPSGPRFVTSTSVATSDAGREAQKAALAGRRFGAPRWLFIVGLIHLGISVVQSSQLHIRSLRDVPEPLLIYGVGGLLLILLAAVALKAPVLGASLGLAVYVAETALIGILVPSWLAKSVVFKVLNAFLLVQGIREAIAYQRLQRHPEAGQPPAP